ncbi:FAD-dependent oxidoreductase [uncultured Mycobacterium sp.]|uniref:FAD-dependent oxidoreductase n=1 Tax=uncultured Mycobacterium sp. TaxID=171292 RepID=UPI0035C9E77A
MSTDGVPSNNADPVVVVGAGVSGLTTAICLAEAGSPVQVWAAEPPAQTTSVVAGALWGPAFQESATQTLAWMAISLREFQQLATVADTGVRLAPVLVVGELANVDHLPAQACLIPELRRCAAAQVPAGFRHGFQATMPLIDMPRYLEYLASRLAAAGGQIDIRRVESLADAAESAPIVVNCAGLGARELAGDDTVEPMFGQHVVLSNPGVDRVFLELTEAADWTCFFPHPQRVVCGGIKVPGRWDRTPEPEVTERILQRCRAVEPRLADAEMIEIATGLRPGRSAVRVEVEPLGSGRCVHNYGHGSNGVTLSWGCARQAAKLALASTASRE